MWFVDMWLIDSWTPPRAHTQPKQIERAAQQMFLKCAPADGSNAALKMKRIRHVPRQLKSQTTSAVHQCGRVQMTDQCWPRQMLARWWRAELNASCGVAVALACRLTGSSRSGA